jgi:hypothetical protein
MSGVSAEKVKLAKEVDLLTYLQHNEPHELMKSSPSEYRTVTNSSLVISNGLWYWHKGQVGGKTALDYLIKVRGMGFVEAVEMVLGSRSSAICSALPVERSPPAPSRWRFYPPKPASYSNKAVAYLQKRGISPDVIMRAMEQGVLYESRYYNPDSPYHNTPVCVFAGKDGVGKIVYAALRGIDADFRLDKAGSDKTFGFTLSAKSPDSRHLACFESPIDLLSHATLQQRNGWSWDGHRISLGGTSSLALLAFLECNPQITRVMLHLDNDEAGLVAARRIKAELTGDKRFKHIRVSVNPPRGVKDYNEALVRDIRIEREQKLQKQQLNRRQADIFI